MKRLGELVEAYGIAPRGRHALPTLLDLLAADPNAPTTVVDPDRGVDPHLADSLVALELDAVRRRRCSRTSAPGAGSPGLPLAAALPDARVVLVESVGRKGAFMRALHRGHGARERRGRHRPRGGVADGVGACDVVTARALAPLNVLSSTPRRSCARAARSWRGRDIATPTRSATAAPPRRCSAWRSRRCARSRRSPSAGAASVVSRKIAPTPAGYPRRPGMARKRPLTSLELPVDEPFGGVRRTLDRPWAPSSRSSTRRAGSARPPPPSTSPPASPRRAGDVARRRGSPGQRDARPRAAEGPRPGHLRGALRHGAGLRRRLPDVDRPAVPAAGEPGPRGRERRASPAGRVRAPPARRARHRARRLRLRAPRLPAVARPADGQRARRGRPRDRARADRVLRARGARRACSTRCRSSSASSTRGSPSPACC